MKCDNVPIIRIVVEYNENFSYSLTCLIYWFYLEKGNWGEWGAFACNCATGIEKRDRMCNNPPPSNGGDFCFGDSSQSDGCAATCLGNIDITHIIVATHNYRLVQ